MEFDTVVLLLLNCKHVYIINIYFLYDGCKKKHTLLHPLPTPCRKNNDLIQCTMLCCCGAVVVVVVVVSTNGSHSLSSFAIFDAMFLKPIDVPDIRLNRTPFKDSRGSLHTSISHCTSESVLGSPCTHNKRNLSRCS